MTHRLPPFPMDPYPKSCEIANRQVRCHSSSLRSALPQKLVVGSTEKRILLHIILNLALKCHRDFSQEAAKVNRAVLVAMRRDFS